MSVVHKIPFFNESLFTFNSIFSFCRSDPKKIFILPDKNQCLSHKPYKIKHLVILVFRQHSSNMMLKYIESLAQLIRVEKVTEKRIIWLSYPFPNLSNQPSNQKIVWHWNHWFVSIFPFPCAWYYIIKHMYSCNILTSHTIPLIANGHCTDV